MLLWVVVLIVVIAAMIVLRKQKFVHVVMFISGCMTLMLLVTACSTVITSGALHSKLHLHVSVEEEFEMSADNNFVILVLDTADSREFTSLLEEHPEYREIFGDFTYFENTTGAYTSTLNAIPFILSGEWYENEGSFQDYLDRVYREAPLWKELKSRNYQIDLYEDDIRAQDASIVDNFDNVYFTKVTPVSYLELAKQELKLVGFRYAPYDLKRYCVIKEVYFNELRESHPEGSDSKAFTADNTAFKEGLAAQGVVMDETGNRFKFIHLNGAHAPFIYDKDANVIGVEQGSYRQSMEASITFQGMFGIFEVFADTIVICTLTAMVILCSGVPVGYGSAAGAELTISGFTATYGGWSSIFTAVALCSFAFSTIIGWGLYGSRCIEFLFHTDKVVGPFLVVYSFVSILGATVDLGLLWSIADTFNGLMSIPNLMALLLLSGTVAKLTKEFFAGEGAGK